MPTVLRVGAYRFFFYAGDADEPPHIHVAYDENIAKFWLDPVRLQNSGGFSRAEINKVNRIINDNQKKLLEAWHEYFGN
ncbi:MAG: DUF4160 domain-containing protein [Nitrospirae bacterium]|nr:MAG: DUF4160 domain-containing protein [Nitrospirota bacterium]